MTVDYGVDSLLTLIILFALGITIQRNAFNVNPNPPKEGVGSAS